MFCQTQCQTPDIGELLNESSELGEVRDGTRYLVVLGHGMHNFYQCPHKDRDSNMCVHIDKESILHILQTFLQIPKTSLL